MSLLFKLGSVPPRRGCHEVNTVGLRRLDTETRIRGLLLTLTGISGDGHTHPAFLYSFSCRFGASIILLLGVSVARYGAFHVAAYSFTSATAFCFAALTVAAVIALGTPLATFLHVLLVADGHVSSLHHMPHRVQSRSHNARFCVC